jgi:protein-S-isoprenylcysteine O-methyltransferase Ste14
MILPFTVTIVVPVIILWQAGAPGEGVLPPLDKMPFPLLGIAYLVIGYFLLIKTNIEFAQRGEGTLAPWDPTRKLVVAGVYRFVRNPMISGVLFVLLGEATFFGSKPLLYWFLIFFTMNAIFIPLVEEKGLEKRFGEEYVEYKRNVPRWIPRIKPWEPPQQENR